MKMVLFMVQSMRNISNPVINLLIYLRRFERINSISAPSIYSDQSDQIINSCIFGRGGSGYIVLYLKDNLIKGISYTFIYSNGHVFAYLQVCIHLINIFLLFSDSSIESTICICRENRGLSWIYFNYWNCENSSHQDRK